MELIVIGSSSAGNSYLLRADDGQTLLIECGCPLSAIKKANNYDVQHIVGAIITHEHGDHAGHVREVLNETEIKVYTSEGTRDEIMARNEGKKMRRDICICKDCLPFSVGDFQVIPILLQIEDSEGNLTMTHDAIEPYCYQIYHKEMGVLLFATDTYCLPATFKGLNQVMIECNYDLAILNKMTEDGKVDHKRRVRTLTSHMSLEACKSALRMQNLNQVRNVVLLHLSGDNSDAAMFKYEVMKATGKKVTIATPGLEMNMNVKPF